MNALNTSVLDLVGNTPLVKITHMDTGPCELYVKLESHNPGGSIKDRIARTMIEAAEKSGRLKPGGTIVEATAGNTGLGLALIAALKGYKVVLVVPDKMSKEKIQHCKALGAEMIITRSDVTKGHPDYYQDVAERIAMERQGYYINQFANEDNPRAHFETTGPEIWEQMGHDVDAVVCGVGSGGTMAGLAKFFKSVNARTEMVLADPLGSILEPLIERNEKIKPGSWLVEGIGEDFIPSILDISVCKKAYSIPDTESFETVRLLLQKEGILGGSSSGTLLAAALKYCREQKTKKRVVTFICDRGDKYLSKAFSDPWIREQGFPARRAATNTVEDLMSRRHERGEMVYVRPTDTVFTAYKRMRVADVSQVPVIEGKDKIVGIVFENTLLNALVSGKGEGFGRSLISDIMEKGFIGVTPQTSLDEATRMLQNHQTLIITENGAFSGLITRVDVLNHMFVQASKVP